MLELFVTLQIFGQRVHDRLTREDGATAVEYGLLVALIAAIIVGIVAVLGKRIALAFWTVCNQLVAGPGNCGSQPT